MKCSTGSIVNWRDEMDKYLVMAAGGGYDILTAHIVAWMLRTSTDAEIDIAGMLNPKFQHFYIDENGDKTEVLKENSIVLLNVRNALRFKISSDYHEKYDDYAFEYCKEHFEERDFMDVRLAGKSEFRLFNFSLKHSPEEQVRFMLNYNKVFLCDAGGDILYGGNINKEIRTPIIDAYALMLARMYGDSGGDCELLIISPGSDRELTKDHLLANLNTVEAQGTEIPLEIARKLKDLFLAVKAGDSGKTIKRMLNSLGLLDEEYESEYACLENKIYKCDIKKAIQLNPLVNKECLAEIVDLYKKISKMGNAIC